MPRSNVPRVFKKRKYHPKSTPDSDIPRNKASGLDVEPQQREITRFSASSRKLQSGIAQYKNFKSDNKNDIVDMSLISELITNFAKCKSCNGEISISVVRRVGLAAEVGINCESCQRSSSTMSCTKMIRQEQDGQRQRYYDINIRLIYAMRAIGRGFEPSKLFCGLMNLPAPHSRVKKHEAYLGNVLCDESNISMRKAVSEAVRENKGNKDLTVALDGTWQKRGFTSLNGVVSATSVNTGKVVDVHVLSKFCRCPERLKNNHKESCSANFLGTSGAMEVEGVKQIFSSSEEKYGVRYTKYLGDGDSKGFLAVSQMAPYGQETKIIKQECIGHVQKRMGSRLRKLKSVLGSQKLSDGKPIGGINRLTDKVIGTIQTYYGLAIRRNVGNLEAMTNDIWAEYFHLLSTNERHNHGLCSIRWCKFKQAQENNTEYDHTKHTHIPLAIMQKIKPIFTDLSQPELLKKCLHGKTQNPNESFNNLIWERTPKTTFVTLPSLKMGVNDAIVVFNEGNIGRCNIYMSLGISPGYFCVKAMEAIDRLREKKANSAFERICQKARQNREAARKTLENKFAAEEGEPSYGAGVF